MTLRHLKIFAKVCEMGTVTKAAAALHLAQPSVSLAVRELEEYYGIQLFERIHRKLYLSETGKKFLIYAQHILTLYDDMEKELRNPISVLRIGSSITIAQILLPDYVEQFYKQYPNVKIHAKIDNSEVIEKRILNNELDLGMIEGIAHNDSLCARKFMNDELICICSNEHAFAKKQQVTLDELESQDFIPREKGSGGRELFDSTMLVHNKRITPIWESVSTKAIINAVAKGFGISVLPYKLVEQDLKEHKITRVQIQDIVFERPYYIIYHKDKYMNDVISYFISLCFA